MVRNHLVKPSLDVHGQAMHAQGHLRKVEVGRILAVALLSQRVKQQLQARRVAQFHS
jgi:hypothetical protein